MGNGCYTREMARWGICAARKPQGHSSLSSVVYVVDGEGKGACKIRFTEAFADAVGLALPEGISPVHPAHLKVMQAGDALWRIFAFYIREERGVLLWETEVKPAWMKQIKRADHGKSKKDKAGAGRAPRPASAAGRDSLRGELAGLRSGRSGGRSGGRAQGR